MERVHRLLVPTLFIMVVTQGFYAFLYFAPKNNNCLAFNDSNATHGMTSCSLQNGSDIHNGTGDSFERTLLNKYLRPRSHQAWFCIYLFVYSQLMASFFSNWHTKHKEASSQDPTCCGKNCFEPMKKRFSDPIWFKNITEKTNEGAATEKIFL